MEELCLYTKAMSRTMARSEAAKIAFPELFSDAEIQIVLVKLYLYQLCPIKISIAVLLT